MRRRAARLLQHARHRCRENAKSKAYHQRNMLSILLARRGRYVLNEPKIDVTQKYVENFKQCIRSKADVKEMLLDAFTSCCNMLDENIKASKLHKTRAVVNISSRKLLNRALKVRKQLECWRIVAMYHLEHQLQHEIGGCKCTDMKPLHMFVSGVGGIRVSLF